MFQRCPSLHLVYTFGNIESYYQSLFQFHTLDEIMLETVFLNVHYQGTIPIRPNVIPLAVFTHNVFHVMSTLLAIFINRW